MKKLRSNFAAPEPYFIWNRLLPHEVYSPLCNLGGMYWWEYFSTLRGEQ